MQETMKRKYTCDRSITVTRLEDLLQDAAVKSTILNISCLLQNVPVSHVKSFDYFFYRMRKSN